MTPTTIHGTDLLPCPFCGGAPELRRIGNDHTKTRAVQVKCSNWECRIERTDKALSHGLDWLEATAIKSWNRRALASPVGADKASDVEVAAQAIYRLFDGAEAHPWRNGGNSNKQDEARRYARAALASIFPPVELHKDYCQRCCKVHASVDCVVDATLVAGVPAQPSQQQRGRMPAEVRQWIEGMSVSLDVSTGDHDADHRYFGVVNEVMDCEGDKHGVTLLAYDAKPNFAAPLSQPVAAEPVIYQHRTRPVWRQEWNSWENCSAGAYEDYAKMPRNGDWHNEVRKLYTAQPSPVSGTTEEPPAFDPTAKYSPFLTMCPRCKNPYHACDGVQAPSAAAEWLRNNYQDYPNIADLCDAMTAAVEGVEVARPDLTSLAQYSRTARGVYLPSGGSEMFYAVADVEALFAPQDKNTTKESK